MASATRSELWMNTPGEMDRRVVDYAYRNRLVLNYKREHLRTAFC